MHALRVWPLRVLLVWGLPAFLLALWLTDLHRHQRRNCDDEAMLRFATPDPGIVLVVPTTPQASRPLKNRRAAGTSRNRDRDHPTAYGVDVTGFHR
ncbi:MAG: hypothetical protein AB1679_17165 [Actinomycetota bacterium]